MAAKKKTKRGFGTGGGRVKGTPNKATAALRERILATGNDPAEVLASFAFDEEEDKELRRKSASDLMSYMYAKLSATQVDMLAKMGGGVKINVVEKK